MILKKNFTARFGLIMLLILSMFIISTNNSIAKKKKRIKHSHRSYNVKANKELSMNAIRSNAELADIAQISPLDTNMGEVTLDKNNQIIGEYGEDIAELEAEDNYQYNAEDFQQIFASLAEDGFTFAGIKKQNILDEAMDLFGTPYRFGGITTKGIDCSAFTRYVYYKVANVQLPRTAREQVNVGYKVKKIKDLQFGDLIFFHTYSRKFASHVGIYLTDGLFVHAGTRYGVAVASINSEFYTKRFIGGRRLTENDLNKYRLGTTDETIDLKAAL